ACPVLRLPSTSISQATSPHRGAASTTSRPGAPPSPTRPTTVRRLIRLASIFCCGNAAGLPCTARGVRPTRQHLKSEPPAAKNSLPHLRRVLQRHYRLIQLCVRDGLNVLAVVLRTRKFADGIPY